MRKRYKPIVWLLMLSLSMPIFDLTHLPTVSAAPETLFHDDFSDGNDNADPEWTVSSGTWTVAADPADSGNKALNQTDTGEGIILSAGDAGWTDSTVTMRFYTGAGGGFPGILARVQDARNFYYFQMQAAGTLILSKRINGADTTIKSVSYAMSKNAWYTLKLVLAGTSIRGYIVENGEDKLVFDATDATYASGKIGIRNKWQSVYVDDVTVSDAPAVNDTAVQSDAQTGSSVSLKWDAVEGATSYNVYRSTTAGSGYAFVAGTASNNFVDTGLSSDTAYYYRIAYVYGGLTESQWSPELSVRTNAAPPAAPTGQTAVTVNSSKISLSWQAADKSTGYRVYRSADAGATFDQIYDGAALSCLDTGLAPNTAYLYQITAYNAYGESGAASTQATTYLFDAPAHFAVASSSDTSVTLNWDAEQGTAVTYTVSKSASAGGTYARVYSGTDTSFTDTGLTQGTGYFYKISATVDGTASPESDPLGVSTVRTAFTPGALWADTDGNPIDAHGAGIMYDQNTNRYYWYGEYHKGGWPSSGVRVYSSTDLLNWKDEGMALTLIQSMDDFTNDPLISKLYAGRTDTINIWADIRKGRIVERPKVMYNDVTKKYVMWAHIDGDKDPNNDSANYGKAQAGVAVSDSPTGPFIYQKSYRMDQAPPGQTDYQPGNPGMARDMNVFKDDDGTAYLIYSSEENLTIYISKLTPDYLDIAGWHKDGNVDENGGAVRDASYKAVFGEDYTRVFPGAQREAPAMFKYKGKYYLLTSGATGWAANQNKYTVADNIMGPWSPMADPFVRTLPTDPDPAKAFNTQTTAVIPVDPTNGKFVYVGDIWNGGNFANNGAKYVFLPIEFGLGTDIAIKWQETWTPNLLDSMGQVNITTPFPEAAALGTLPSLPSHVDVLDNDGGTVSTPVTWAVNGHEPSMADFSTPGSVTLQIALPDYNNKIERVKMYVIPDKTMFFVNGGGYATPDYSLLSSYMLHTLVNKNVPDQAYSAEDPTPWGYVGADTLPSGSAGGDIFSTVRYLNGGNMADSPKGKDLTYKFTVDDGAYDVYLGFNDPWTNATRKADLLINGTDMGPVTFTPSNTMAFTGVDAANRSLEITVRNTAAQDPMISWIMIVNRALTPAADPTMGLAGTPSSSTTVTMTWHKTIGATGYNLYRSGSADGTYAPIYSGMAGAFTDTGLQGERTYYYKVGYVDGSGSESALSDALSVSTPSPSVKEIADGITSIAPPAKDAALLTLPVVPDGFRIAIRSSDHAVIGTDGVITPPGAETTVHLVLEVTKTSDGSTADTGSLSVVVPAKSSGNPGSSTGGSTGGAATIDRPLTPEVTNDSAKLTMKAELDAATRVARAAVTETDLTQAFMAAPRTGEGKRVVALGMPKVEGATAYELQLPAAFLTSVDPAKVIELKTALGTVTLPAGMFSAADLGSARQVSIRIAVSAASAAPSVGGRPVIDISVTADDRAVDFNNADAPVTVTIPYSPTADEAGDADHLVILYIHGDGTTEPVSSGRYDPSKEAMVFTTTHFSTYAVAFVYKTFDDLSGVAWAKAQIEALASKGIINGISDHTYSPNGSITRADFIRLLVSTLGLSAEFDSNFADVPSTAYFAGAVGIAKKLGITDGIGGGAFNPDAPISRQDMMTLTARAMLTAKKLDAISGTAADLISYADASKTGAYAVDSIATLVKNGIIKGDGELISPHAHATRAEAAVMLYNIYKR